MLQKIVNKEIDNLSELLEELEPLERINVIAKLLPYIVPKQAYINQDTNFEVKPIEFTILKKVM